MPPKPKPKPRPVPRRGTASSTPGEGGENLGQNAPPEGAAASTTAFPTAAEVVPATSIAPPAGRLDSLSTRPATAGSARGAPLKFKPKFVQRKTKEEREQLEAKYTSTSASMFSRGPSSRGPRGRGRGGRGRGGLSGASSRDQGLVTGASGPFSMGSVISGRQKIAVERGLDYKSKQSLSSSFKGKMKFEGENGETKAEYSSSDESDGPKMDVEYIALLDEKSEDEDGDKEMDREALWGAGAPVRVARSEHVDRTTLVNTEASTKKGKELKGKGKGKGKEKESILQDGITIKDEPVDDDVFLLDGPSSPETKKVIKPNESPEAKRKAPRRMSNSRKYMTPQHLIEQERREAEHVLNLKELLGDLPAGDGDVEMTEGTRGRNPDLENQIFIFQVPNFLPPMVPTDTPEDTIKSEPIGVDKATTADTANPSIKTESSSPSKPPPKKLSVKAQEALLDAPPSAGIIGQLRLHKSGRMTMLWGGGGGEEPIEFEVNRGTPCLFLQEVVVMKEESPWGDEDVDEKGRRKGVVYSMGQVKGKWILSPNIEQLLNAIKKARRKKKLKKEREEDASFETSIESEYEDEDEE